MFESSNDAQCALPKNLNLTRETGYQTQTQMQATRHRRAVSTGVKRQVAAAQGWRCVVCRELLPAAYEVDHRVALQFGGTNHPSNLQALCRDCHGQKTIVESATTCPRCHATYSAYFGKHTCRDLRGKFTSPLAKRGGGGEPPQAISASQCES